MEPTKGVSVLHCHQKSRTFDLARLIFCASIKNNQIIEQTIVNTVKKNSIEGVTGLLFIYNDFLISLIESSEENIFQFVREVFIVNTETITSIKCLYIQYNAKKRFFEELYVRRIKDDTLKIDALQKYEDNNVACSLNIFRTVILNLYELYVELWNISQSQHRRNFIQRLDLISLKGDHRIPSKNEIEFILQSAQCYDLVTLVKDYYNLNYISNFDDYSQVSEIIQETCYNSDVIITKKCIDQ